MTAPIQLLTLSVSSPDHATSLIEELSRVDSSAVTMVDALLVEHVGAGEVETHELAGSPHVDGSVLTALLIDGAESSREAVDAVWSLAASSHESGLVLLVLIEHRWADPLTTSVRESGARLVDETWLTSDDRDLVKSHRN